MRIARDLLPLLRTPPEIPIAVGGFSVGICGGVGAVFGAGDWLSIAAEFDVCAFDDGNELFITAYLGAGEGFGAGLGATIGIAVANTRNIPDIEGPTTCFSGSFTPGIGGSAGLCLSSTRLPGTVESFTGKFTLFGGVAAGIGLPPEVHGASGRTRFLIRKPHRQLSAGDTWRDVANAIAAELAQDIGGYVVDVVVCDNPTNPLNFFC